MKVCHYPGCIIFDGRWPRRWTLYIERWTLHLMWWTGEDETLRDIFVGWAK